MTKPFTSIAIALFAVIGLMHLLRVVLGWPMNVAGADIPMWPSIIAVVVSGLMAVMLWKENK